MKKVLKLNNTLIVKIVLMCIWIYSCIKWVIPYNRAKLTMAYRLYMETTMYKEREAGFGKAFAFEQFVDNREHRYFLKKLTFFDKVKAVFIPYSYIDVKEEN